MKQLSILVLFLCLPVRVYADPACMDNVKSEEEINVCQHSEAKKLELQVKGLEEKIQTRLADVQLERFKTAQQLWLDLTQKDCELAADFYEGASVYPAIQSQCLQQHYQARILVIRNFLCPEHQYLNGCEAAKQTPVK